MDRSDTEFRDWLFSIKKKLSVVLIIISVLLIVFGYCLINIEDSDGVSTLSGQYISWTTTPYSDIGYPMILIGIIMLILSLIYYLKLILIKK